MLTSEQVHKAILSQMDEETFEQYEERAAILEFDAHLPRKQAEGMALMMMQNRRK